MSKTVPATKFTEWKGLDRISRIVHEMGCIFRELSKDDVGLDGEIEVVTPKSAGEGFCTTGGIVKVQAKAGRSYVVSDTPTSFAAPVDKDDLEYWHSCTFPVLFIVYHPDDDKLYYREVKAYIQATPGVFKPPLRIEFDKSQDEFTASAKPKVHEQANGSPPRITFGVQERMFANLLPITKLPKYLNYAPTRRRDEKSIRREIDGFTPPFTIVDGKLYTLADLFESSCVLRKWCGKRVRRMLATEWIDDIERFGDFMYLLNQLLGKHAARCGIRYNRDFRRNYFPRENDTDLDFTRSWTSARTGKPARPRLVAKRYEYGKFKFWRHLAAELSFRQFGKSWFLQVVPMYFFTEDGTKPCSGELAGPYTTYLKARERNPQVLNHILFWSDVLSLKQNKIRMQLDGKTQLAVEKLPAAGLAPFGIPDDLAVYEEEDAEQPTLFDEAGDTPEEDDDDD